MNNDKLNPIKFFKEMIGKVSATDLLMKLFGKLMKTLMGPIFQELNQFAETVNNAKNNIEKKIKAIKQIAKMIKKILKLIIKAIIKVIKVLVKVVVWLVSTPPGWCVLAVLLIVLLICYLSTIAEALGGFRGTVIVDVDKMKEMNIDSTEYTDVLNTDALLEAFYQDVSDKSYYQMFNIRNMSETNVDGVTELIVNIGAFTGLWGEEGLDYEDRKNKTVAAMFANNKEVNGVKVYNDKYVTGFSGILNFPQYDPRYIYTDANKNPLKYLKKAEIIGTNENTGELSAYFRDYYKRESTFMLSEELLYELNKFMYMDKTGANSIVYPEAFTQPLHFVNDYMRIDSDKTSKTFGKDYVYVTQRINLEDINNQDSEFYGKKELEGIIYSTPSKYLYDYAILSSNLHTIEGEVEMHSTKSLKQINIGNVTDYITYSYDLHYDEDDEDDKDGVEEIVRLYWKVKDDKMDVHMGVMIGENNVCEYFEGPFLEMNVEGGNINFKKSLNICSADDDKMNDEKDFYFGKVKIDVDNNEVNYSLGEKYTEDKEKELADKNTDTLKYINPKLNLYPRKHVQVAPIEDDLGNVIATSRNLFNKVYIQVKTIKNPYRSSDEYWSRFSEFIDADLEKSAARSKCTGDEFKADMEQDWSGRECSVIRYYMTDNAVDWIKAKGAELLAWFKTGDGTDASLNITEKAMYAILLDYEDFLMSVGTFNVEWEYKYFSQTENDKLESMSEHSNSFLKWISGGGSTGDALRDLFGETDARVYKNTFDSVVSDANKRSVASEYVPVAIITGNEYAEDGTYNGKNTWGWGYKYTGEKTDGKHKVKPVYGEASMQFPEYYTMAEDEWGTFWGSIGSSARQMLKTYTNVYNSPLGKILESATEFFSDTTYGEVTYGMPNFKYAWKGNSLLELPWYGNADDKSENYWLNYKTVKDERGNYIDFRNEDLAWNPDAKVWRPVETSDKKAALMTECTGLQCGRVTTHVAADDYLPMEVRGVRDYGLGSILSYVESRKVVFNTGVSMREDYNIDGVKKYVEELDKKLGNKNVLVGDDGVKGYIPKEILDLALEGFSIEIDGETKENATFLNVYRKMPTTTEHLKQLAMLFNNAQGTEDRSVTYNGCTYSLSGTESTQYKIVGSGTDCVKNGSLYAFVPHVDGTFLVNFWNKLTKGDNGYNEDQFWDPMYYYLSWFDHLKQEVNADNIWSKALMFIDGKDFYSFLDTEIAAELRKIKNKEEGTEYNLSGLSNIKHSWFFDVFGDAGTDLSTGDMEEFFEQYGNHTNGLDLIDRIQSQEVYLIEEAATFIGEFMYTYQDVMKVIGNLTEKDAIIADLAFIDRYYYLSNYIFALPATEHKLQQSGLFYDDPDTCKKNCKSAKTKCEDWLDKIEEDNKTVIWWQPWTWFKKAEKVYDFGSGKCLKGKTDGDDPETVYKGIIKYKVTKDANVVIMDTAEETVALIKQLKKNKQTNTAKKVMINLKVYADVEGWAGLIKDNESDIHDGINYVGDAFPMTSTDYKKTPGVSDLNNFTTYSKIFENIKFRKGLLVDYGDKTDENKMLLTDNKNFDDEKYEIGFKNGISEDLIGDIATDNNLTENDLKQIKKAIMEIHGLKDSVKTNKNKIKVGKTEVEPYTFLGVNVGYKEGKEWGDHDDMLVSLLYADRASEGYPLPLFLHVAGDTKQIMPEEVGKFFDGEVLDTWKKRVTLNDEDSIYRDEYVRNYHKEKESYLYDYLENFEAYVPLDVKTDEDMQLRGRDAFLSIGSNDSTPIEKVSASTNAIMQSVLNEEWTKIYNRYNINAESIAQLLAGLMEYSINNAADKTIAEYNEYREGRFTLIKDDYKNKKAIQEAVEATMYTASTGGTDVNSLRRVELILEDDTTASFLIPYVGVAGIKNIDFSAKNGTGDIISGEMTTANTGSAVEDDRKLTIGSGVDDRLIEQSSIDYVSVKFRKLFSKYGSAPAAIMAYFYGETYWDNLKKVATEEGLSTGPEWYVAEDNMIEKAVNLSICPGGTECGIKVNTELYTSKVVDDVFSYINSIDDRVKMVRSQAVMTDSTLPDGQNDEIVFAYAVKIMGLDEQHALSLMAVLGGESGGWESRRLEGDYGEISPMSLNYIDEVNTYISNGSASGKAKFREYCGKKNGFGIAQWTACGRKDSLLELAKEKGVSIGDLGLQLEYLKYELEAGYGNHKGGKSPYEIFLATNDPFEQVDILVRNFEIPANKTKAVQQRMEIRARDLEPNIERFRTAAGTFDDGSLTGNGGLLSSGGGYFENTSAYNSYTRDELSLQNSGIELWTPPVTFKRGDIDMVMLSQASRDGDFVDELNSYDLLSLFTSRQGPEGALGGTWEYGDTSIQALGTGTDREVEQHELSGMPPLFRTNRPFAEGVPMRLTSPFGYRNHPVYGGRRMHQGIDLGTGATTPDLFAIAPGKVIINQFNSGGYGWYIVIEHDLNCISSSFKNGGDYIVSNGDKKYKILGVQSLYAHQLVQSPLPIGTLITPENINQKIGTVGSTGASTGNHLHMEIKVKAQEITESGMPGRITDYLRVDPQVWLTTSWYADESGSGDSGDVGDTGDGGDGGGMNFAGGSAVGGVYMGHEVIRAY